MSGVKLTYFNLKALGEPIRWLLHYGKISFEDCRIEFEQWPALKPSIYWGQLPTYEEDGKISNQSLAICRYLGKKVGLVGKDDWENLEIDALADTINDLRLHIAKYGYEKDETIKQQVKEKLFNETLPYYLEKLEKIVENGNGYLALGKLTWADVYFIAILDYLNHLIGGDLLENRPHLQKLRVNVTNIPSIKSWVDKRPDTYM